ncbi:S8 family serine peptidase [Polaribacter porphyrae]|uniref:Peptidase S8 n=1 Tax=Polaribacter porphyrae TaxID=1137780 RepID=A0A2S7WKP6_9FLAO|nr:S8 family serine peptidase [Polaribacter porphyrae]PQJ78180.1 peptidase S8 [Polaribacter porphyrae]
MKKLLFLGFILISISCFSQTEDAWLFLKDKPNASTFIENPLTMISQRAIDRRNKLGIVVDEKDVPIHSDYYNQLKNEGNITVLGKSKWLNAIHIQGTVSQINGLLPNFTFIESIEFANKSLNKSGKKREKRLVSNHKNKFAVATTNFNYGSADNQIKMLKGDFLHKQGLTGEGQVIAVIDAGFPNVDNLDAFKRIRDNNQILGGYNFADRNTNFYTRNNHGTHVLSTIAGYLENQFVGTAPDAKFYLFISEIAETETVLEETLWVEAAERADSLGVDVINTSLGYTTYDNPNHSHSYADMDGKTIFISRGAEIAASRGMLLVNSVGNSGNSSWKYMGAPADATSVISVGAVNASGDIASFSSFGPTADLRIKPEILGQGASAAIINYTSGQISSSNGTSFSGPILAGLIACLNQNQTFSLKSKSTNFNEFLKSSVYESADRFNNPTAQHGYGIPNFEEAFNIYVGSTASINDNYLSSLKVFPNPTKNIFTIVYEGSSEDLSLQIFNILGKKVLEISKLTSKNIDISTLDKGIYLLKIKKKEQQKILKLIKQ